MYNKIKLLIVDDNLDDIYIIRKLLKDITIIRCEHENSLNRTLKLLEKEKFDCILLDLNLPDSLGTDTLKDVLDKYPEIPIVVLTVIDDEDTAIQSLHEGAQDYLVKGKINGDIISRSIRHAIERKKVENDLRESEKKYRDIANTILEGLWITDEEGKTTYVNKQLAKMLYYTEEEILNKPFFDFVDKSLQHEARQFFERRKKGIRDRYDFRFTKKDGSTLWVTVSASPIFDKKGKFAGAMGLLTDITNRKSMEQSLEKSIQEWNTTFNAISDIICVIDLDGKMTHCNHAADRLFKKSNKEIIGKTCWEVLNCPSDRLKNCPIINMQKTHKRETLTLKIDDKWFHSVVDPIVDNKGNIVGGVHIISDITKYKLSQDALKESELALKQSQHIAHVGHWILFPKTNKLIWSDEMFNIFGIAKEQFNELQADLDKIIDKTIHSDDIEKVRESSKKVKLEGHTAPLEYRTVWPNGTIHTVWMEPGENIINESGDITKLFGTVQDITERKQIEKKLRKNEENLKRAQRVANVGNWEWDIEKDKIIWSEETFNLHNIDPKQQEPTYKELLKYYHPEDLQNFENAIEDAVKNGVPYTIVCRVILPSGSTRYLEGRGEAIHDNKGNIIKLFGTSMDITEHVYIIDALKESEEKWRLITENSSTYILTTDLDGIVQFTNRSISIPKEQVIGTSIYNYIPDKFKQDIKNCFEEVKNTRKPGKYYVELVLPDSNVFSFDSNVGPIIKSDKLVGFVINSSDITEQKIIQDKLKESEELYRTITEYSNDMIWTLDRDGNFTFFNKRSEQISGYKLEELKGKSFRDLIVEKDIEKVIDIFHSTLNGNSQQYEITFINKFNKLITLSVNTTPIYSKGQIIGTLSSGRDITETVKVSKELKISNEKLAASNKELQDFAYVASHDLQEPLRAISGFVALLAGNYKGKLGPEADEYIEFITTGSKRMQDMINDLLAISRVGTRAKKFEPVNIERILRIVFKNLHTLIDETQAVITCDPVPTIIADDSQIVQLFQNLIDNAIKFRREETPKIHISCEGKNGYWLFSVQDNGIGIDKNGFKKLFIIFQRLHSRDKYPGTGIGLAMCKKIVERHGGNIWVESNVGIGSTFFFTIPTKQIDSNNDNSGDGNSNNSSDDKQ